MELWIRSQDKRTLLKANRIDVDDTDIICWDNDYRCSETYMGKYKTQKRALEVLDEIQKKLRPSFYIYESNEYDKPKTITNTTPSLMIYEMPKE